MRVTNQAVILSRAFVLIDKKIDEDLCQIRLRKKRKRK